MVSFGITPSMQVLMVLQDYRLQFFSNLLLFGVTNLLLNLYSDEVSFMRLVQKSDDVRKGMCSPALSLWMALVMSAIINVISRVRKRQRLRQ